MNICGLAEKLGEIPEKGLWDLGTRGGISQKCESSDRLSGAADYVLISEEISRVAQDDPPAVSKQ